VGKIRVIKATKSAFEWVQHGHKIYVAARYLFMTGFDYNACIFGCRALELYFKAFSIYKTGGYLITHKLDKLYEKCKILDDFFKDDELGKHFLPEKARKYHEGEYWYNYYLALNYPELTDDQKLDIKRHQQTSLDFSMEKSPEDAGTFNTLDNIAYFMYKSIPPGRTFDIIEKILSGDRYIPGLGIFETSAKIKEVFLRNNKYFKE